MPFYPHGGGGKFDDGGGGGGHSSHGAVRDEASCVLQQASSGGVSGSTLKAHDYIGLSEVSSMPASKASAPSAVPDLNLGETELRLGPPKTAACKAQAESPASAPKDKATHWQASHRNMEAAPPAAQPQPLQPQPQPQEMNAPKSGAKRGFSEAIGNGFVEGRSVSAPVGGTPAAASKQSTNPLMPCPWNSASASAKLPAAWRMGLEQSKGGFGPFPSASRPKIDGGDNRSSWEKSASASPASASSKLSQLQEQQQQQQQQQQMNKDDSSDEVAQASSPPVVGWPPVQSFRKNTLASHPPPPAPSQLKSSAESKTSTAAVAAATANVAAPPPPAPAAVAGGTSPPLFVKVYMDGVPIGRKVDLKLHSSYDKLSTVLEEMFQRFVSGQNGEVSSSGEADQHKKLSFLHGSEFVLTYEDKDGDLMLVGDVPWGMFTGTVKRLRIMKGSEAIGLAPRTAGDNKVAAL